MSDKTEKDNALNEALVKAFKESREAIKTIIVGDIILVGRLPKQELKTAGGIIVTRGSARQINAFDSNLPQFVQVLAVGEGFYNEETGESVPVDLEPGNVIEVAGHAVNWFSSFGVIPDSAERGTGIGITREPEYRMKFKSYDDYLKFMEPFKRIDMKE